MDEAPPPGVADAALPDLLNASPRTLMNAVLPAARKQYIKAWELLADASVEPERRRQARLRVKALAADHAAVSEFLRGREPSLAGDDLLNARHLIAELDRHVEALHKMATISALGLMESEALRPESLGCGKRYRVPAPPPSGPGSASRIARGKPAARASREQRRDDKPFSDRGPKAPRDALGTSKHGSKLGDSLDEETRVRLEALRQALEP